MIVKNLTQNTILSNDCNVADNFFSRFKGLLGKKYLPQGSGLLITPCNSIHMFFMKFPIDVVFIDKSHTVVYIVEGIKPWKFTKLIRKAHSVIELPEGTIEATKTSIGDKLELII